MTTEITNTEDTIDSRDVIERIDELQSDYDALVSAKKEAIDARDSADEDELEKAEEALDAAEEDLKNFDELDELNALTAFASEGEQASSEWHDGATLVLDSFFTEYAQQLAEEIGLIDAAGTHNWPFGCIDWGQAAEELQQDYTTADFDGETYWVRS